MLESLRFSRKLREMHIDEALPVRDARYVVLDTELTGLNERKDSIISIGAIRMTGGRIELNETFYRLIKPEAAMTSESVVVHGITPSEVAGKPGIHTVLAEFIRFCGSDILVGHCISIDLCFLCRELKSVQGMEFTNAALDTLAIYEWLKKRVTSNKVFSAAMKGCSLYDIARQFGIATNGAHNAIMDAFITAQLFQRFIPLLHGAGIQDIGELLRVGNPSRGGDTFRVARDGINL